MKFCTEPVFVDPRGVTAIVCGSYQWFTDHLRQRGATSPKDRRFVWIGSRQDCYRLRGLQRVRVEILSEPADMVEIAEQLVRYMDPADAHEMERRYAYRNAYMPLIREVSFDQKAFEAEMLQRWTEYRPQKIRLSDVQSD